MTTNETITAKPTNTESSILAPRLTVSEGQRQANGSCPIIASSELRAREANRNWEAVCACYLVAATACHRTAYCISPPISALRICTLREAFGDYGDEVQLVTVFSMFRGDGIPWTTEEHSQCSSMLPNCYNTSVTSQKPSMPSSMPFPPLRTLLPERLYHSGPTPTCATPGVPTTSAPPSGPGLRKRLLVHSGGRAALHQLTQQHCRVAARWQRKRQHH